MMRLAENLAESTPRADGVGPANRAVPSAPILRINNLTIGLRSGRDPVRDVSFRMYPGETLGIVGELARLRGFDPENVVFAIFEHA